jgi:hypothetical protein
VEQLTGAGGRYRARIEVLQETGDGQFTQQRTMMGARARPGEDEWTVLLEDCCSLRLHLGEGGITLRSVGLMGSARAIIRIEIEAGAGAPEWLPASASLQLFDGDRQDAALVRDRFLPLPGAVEVAGGSQPLEQLLIAVGRSIARANAALVQIQSPGGTALVSTLTVQVAADQIGVERGRAVVKPSGQPSPVAGAQTGAPGGPQIRVNRAGASPGPTLLVPGVGQGGAGTTTGTAGGFMQFTLQTIPGAPAEPVVNSVPGVSNPASKSLGNPGHLRK